MPEEIKVRVALRCRPLLPWEVLECAQECITYVEHGGNQVVLGNQRPFTFDFVFDPSSSQHDLYSATVSPLIESAFDGFNATIMAYGQTGSGKTYSMGSGADVLELDEKDQGIIPIAIDELFKGIEKRKDKTKFQIRVSFLELYNEEIRDLLKNTPFASSHRQHATLRFEGDELVGKERALGASEATDGKLVVHDTPEAGGSGVFVLGLTELVVTNKTEMLNALVQGSHYRSVGSHALNVQSSRSHAIFTVKLVQMPLNADPGISDCTSKIHFVDLAGSERQKRTKAEGLRFREGIHINTGLLVLGNVISDLGDNDTTLHINYRDSKLTRMLQDSLGGNSKTVMIACVSPADTSFEETLNTLKYADRARKIVNKPIKNIDPISQLIQQLRRRIVELEANQMSEPVNHGHVRRLETELEQCHDRISDLSARLEKAHLDHAMLQFGVDIEDPVDDLHVIFDADAQDIARSIVYDIVSNVSGLEERVHDMLVGMVNEIVEEEEEEEEEEEVRERQLTRIQREIQAKETLLHEIERSKQHVNILRLRYQSRLRKMTEEIHTLERERDTVLSAMETQTEVSEVEKEKIRDDYRRRLKGLQERMKRLSEHKTQHENMKQATSQSDTRIHTLIKEIKNHKREHDRLQHIMQKSEKRVLRLEMDVQRKTAQLSVARKSGEGKDRSLKTARRELREAQKALRTVRSPHVPTPRPHRRIVQPIDTLGSSRSHARWLADRVSAALRRRKASLEIERLTRRRERLTHRVEGDDDESLHAELEYVTTLLNNAQHTLSQADEEAGDITVDGLVKLGHGDVAGILHHAIKRILKHSDDAIRQSENEEEMKAALADETSALRSVRAELAERNQEMAQLHETHQSEVMFLLDQLEAAEHGNAGASVVLLERQVKELKEKLTEPSIVMPRPRRASLDGVDIPTLNIPKKNSPSRTMSAGMSPLPPRPATASGLPWRRGAGRVPAHVAAAMQAARMKARTERDSPSLPDMNLTASPDRSTSPVELVDKSVATLTGHDGPILALASLGGSAIMSSSADRTIRLWNVAAQQETGVLQGHRGMVRCLAWIRERGVAISGSQDRTLRIWSADAGTCIKTIDIGEEVFDIHHDIDYNRIYVALGDGRIQIYDLSSFELLKAVSGRQRGAVFCVDTSDKFLFGGSRDHSVSVFSRDTLRFCTTLIPLHYDGVMCCLADGSTLYTGSRDKTVKVWSLKDRSKLDQQRARTVHRDWVSTMCMHEGLLHTGSKDGTIGVWNTDLAPQRDPMTGHQGPITSLVSLRGPILVSGSQDRLIKLWSNV